MTLDELKALRNSAGLSTRQMSALALLADPTGWSKVECGRSGIDPARLLLVQARVAVLRNEQAQALTLLRFSS